DRLGQDEAALLTAMGRCQRNSTQLRAAWRSFMRAVTVYRERGENRSAARVVLEIMTIWAAWDRKAAIVRQALDALGDEDPHLRALLQSHLGSNWGAAWGELTA